MKLQGAVPWEMMGTPGAAGEPEPGRFPLSGCHGSSAEFIGERDFIIL